MAVSLAMLLVKSCRKEGLMKSAIFSRLLTFGLICLVAGYIVVANTTPAASVAAMRGEYTSAIVQTPFSSQPLLHTVEVNLPPTPAAPALAAHPAHAPVHPLIAQQSDDIPHGPHDDILAIFAKPDVEVSRPRSPFLEPLARAYEPAKPQAAPALSATVRDSRESSAPKKVKRTKGRRLRTTNPFSQLWQPKFRAFDGDNPFRESNQGLFGPRTSKRRTGRTY
jgi:hypothetical protein